MTDRERLMEQVGLFELSAAQGGKRAGQWMVSESEYYNANEKAITAGHYAQRAAHHALAAMALREAIDCLDEAQAEARDKRLMDSFCRRFGLTV